jgi:D-alanyl-D-alanine carboxypeptidase
MKHAWLAPALFVSVVQLLPAQRQTPAAFVNSYAREHDFSGTIAIAESGRVTLSRSYGLANRAFRIPNTPRTRYRIASITKAFTATLILQLVDEGLLDLQQPFGRYLPAYRGPGADRITIHQLLNHTSGLANYDKVTSAEQALTNGIPAYQTPLTASQLLERVSRDTIVHPPGTVFDYNNGEYIILGRVVEQLRGKPYATVLSERILRPLGMANSGVLRQAMIVDSLADSYFYREDLKALANDLPAYAENWDAAGAMYSTTADLLRFAGALFGARILKPESLALMVRPGLDDYGYGVWSFESKFGDATYHVVKRPGQIMGTNSQLFRIVERDITIIMLANTGAADLDEFAAELGRRVVAAQDHRH